MITKFSERLVIALMAAWTLVVLPDIARTSTDPISGVLDLVLGSLWIGAVPGVYFLALRCWLRRGEAKRLKGSGLVVTAALGGGFIVSYAVLAYYVGLGALTVIHLGGMYESNLLWAFAPLVAGKFSPLGVLAGGVAGAGTSAFRHARV